MSAIAETGLSLIAKSSHCRVEGLHAAMAVRYPPFDSLAPSRRPKVIAGVTSMPLV